MLGWLSAIGVCQGVFALFTMYLPPLFPTLLRTTGAGFSYNIGRLAAAVGTVYFGTFGQAGDYRLALLYASFLFLPAAAFALLLPELPRVMTDAVEPVRLNRCLLCKITTSAASAAPSAECRRCGSSRARPACRCARSPRIPCGRRREFVATTFSCWRGLQVVVERRECRTLLRR